MNEDPLQVVFDCSIFVQSLLNPVGAAGACVQQALTGNVRLFVSDFVLDEVRDTPHKPTPARLGITHEKVERLLDNLLRKATFVDDVPHVFDHPIDPDDAHYVDLAVATQSIIISRDRHLLGLNAPSKPWSAGFRQRFADLRICTPESLLEILRQGA